MAIDTAITSELIPKITKFRIIRNLIFISLSFFLLFTAYDGLSMLQSTMNKTGGVGVMSQAAGYISFCISAFLLPNYVIKKLGHKSSLIFSISLYLPGIAANLYPKWYIMIPSGFLCGIGASILWGSQCTYFNESAVRYAKLITDGSINLSHLPYIPSNCTSLEILSDRNSKCETIEENPVNEGPLVKDKSEVTASEDIVLRYTCRNSSCGNVEEFAVTEIKKNCVKFIENTADSSNNLHITEEEKSSHSEHLPSIGIYASRAQTNESERGIMKENPLDGTKLSKVEEIIKNEDVNYGESASPKRNPDNQSIFQRVPSNQGCQPIFQKANILESVTGFFFGCHGIAYYSAQICSNVISYYVLKGDDVPKFSYLGVCTCGAQFCNQTPLCINDDAEYVSERIRYLLTCICVAIGSISVLLVFFFVDPLKKVEAVNETERTSLRLVLATFSHNKKKEQLCLIPLSFFVGMLQGFYTADFTKSYVGCSWGASNVGLVSMFYGSACVISSATSGLLVKYVGRMPLFLLGQVIGITMMAFLLVWKPDSNTPYKFYVAAIFFGTITAVYWSQLLAFYGLLFKKDEEAAFASYYLWSSLGWTTSFLYSDHLCTYVKIYLLLTVSILGTIGYLFAEKFYSLRKQQGTIAII